jgi:hypothetical protein
MHDALLGACQELLLGVRAPALAGTRDRALGALDDLRGTLATLLRGDPDVAALHLRALVTRMARLAQVALLLEDAGAAQGEAGLGWLGAAAELLLDRWVVRGYEPVADATYPALVRRVLGD